MTTARVPAARAGNDGIRFGLVELDLLATHAGVRLPFPLRVPEFGRIAAEREVVLAAAGATLRTRGLADGAGPLGVAGELVTALREYRGTVDLVIVGTDSVIGVVAMLCRSSALICGQPLTGAPTTGAWIRRVARNALAEELMGMVPEVATATAGVVDDLVGVPGELTGSGQLGATHRDSVAITRPGTELSWLDGPRGRVRVDQAPDGRVSVNPLRPSDLRHALDEFVMIAGKEQNGHSL